MPKWHVRAGLSRRKSPSKTARRAVLMLKMARRDIFACPAASHRPRDGPRRGPPRCCSEGSAGPLLQVIMYCDYCGCPLLPTHKVCPDCGNKISPKYKEPKPGIACEVLDPEIEKEVDAKVIAIIGEGGYLGYCHGFWATKKHILREEYGIEWKTPAELHPDICYD